MSDFIDRFEAQLLAVSPRPLRLHQRARRWVGRHTLVTVVLVGAATATAGATVTTLIGSPSAPLSGPLIPATSPGAKTDGRYVMRFSASTVVGEPGWCQYIAMRSSDPDDLGVGWGCGPAPRQPSVLIASGFSGSLRRSMAYFVVTRSVAGVRLANGHVVRSRPDPALPADSRAIVVFSGDPGNGTFDNRDMAR